MYFPSWPVLKALCKAVQYCYPLPTDGETEAQSAVICQKSDKSLDSEIGILISQPNVLSFGPEPLGCA